MKLSSPHSIRRIVLACGAITAGAGALVLVGWALGSDTLTAMGTGYIPMAPNTGLLFALLGSAVLVRELWPANWMIHRAVAAAAIVSALVGSVTLAGFVTGLNIDEWLFRSTRTVGAVPIGHMSFLTALCFVLAGVSLWLAERQAKTGAAVLGILVALAGTVCLTGYWFGSPLFYGGNLIPVALPTSLALVALGVALIAAARPNPWPLNALIGALTLAIFALDWLTPLGYAEWLLYLIPLLLTKWTQRRRSPVVVAAICSVLVAAGFFLSAPGIDTNIAIFNRALGVAVLWITAVLLALHKRAEEDIRQRNRELTAIGDLIATTATTLDLQTVLDRALRGAMELTGMEGGTICTVDPERQSLELAAHVNTSPETIADLTANVIQIGDCLCGHCAKTGEPLILWDNASGSEFATREATRNEGIRFHAAFPLLAKRGCIGVLCVFARSDRKPAQRSLDLVRDLCGPVALAIENARLFKAVHDELTVRKQAEAALRAKTEELDRYFTNSLDLLCIADTDGYFRRLNPEWERTLGYPLGELKGRRFLDFVHPEDVAATLAAVEKLSSQAHVLDFVNRYRHKDGSYRWLEWRAYAEDSRIYAVARDITARKQAEAALRGSEESFRSLFANMLEGVAYCRMIFDDEDRPTDFVYVKVNRSFERLTGLKNVVGKKETEVFPGIKELHPEMFEVFGRVALTGQPEQFEIDFKPLKQVFFLSVYSLEKGHCILTFDNITARKQAEESLRQSEELFSTTFHVGPAGMTITRIADGKFLNVNDAFLRLFEFSREEAIGHTSTELNMLCPEERAPLIQRQHESGGLRNAELRAKTKSGRLVNLLFSSKPMQVAGEECHLTTLIDITERKQAEAALRASEANYRTLMESASDGVFITDARGRLLDANVLGCRMLGYAREEISGLGISDIVPAEEVARVAPELGRLNAGEVMLSEWQFRRKDGTRFPGEVSATVLPDGRLLGILRDITERKQAETALRESEAKFRAIIESSPVAMAVNDEHGNITFLNRKFIETFGYTLADIPTLAAWWPRGYPDPAYRQRVAQEWQAAVEKAQRDRTELEPMEYQVAGKDGTVRDIRFSMAPMGASNLVIFYDLTERKQAEAALCESEERLRHVLDGLGPQMFAGLLDLQGTVLLANRPALEAAALRSENVLGKPVADTYWWTWSEAVSQRLRAAVERAAQGEPVRYDEQIRVAEGQLIWLDFSIHPLRDETGRIRFLVPSGLVITERKQAEESLRQSSEQLRALTQRLQSAREEEARRIARELHDELGQMLTGLKMDLRWVERDLEEGETDARTNALLEKVVAASELVDGTVKTVQRIAAELRSGLLDKLGLAMALRHESQQFQQRTGVTCRLRVPEPEPRLPAEVATACYRICQEALTNVARHAAATEVEIELRAETGAWLLEIHDNGKGIAAAKLTDPHSLGLIGMQERARHLGGEVSIGPGAEGGTVVRLRIPQAGAKTEDVS